MVALILDSPFYAHILSEMQPVITDKVSVAAVQPRMPMRLFINARAFDRLAHKHRMGVLKHEVLHLVMEHFIRGYDRDHMLFNLAGDLAVNELIEADQLPPSAVTVPSISGLLGIRLPRKAAAEVYYDILKRHSVRATVMVNSTDSSYDSSSMPGVDIQVEVEGKRGTYRQYDDHTGSGDLGGAVARELMCELVRQVVDRAVKSCGIIPAGLEVYLQAIQERKVNWRRALSRFLLGRGYMLTVPTYLREAKRYDSYPGRRKQVGMQALVAIDTSSSMGDRTLAEILGHLLQIKKISGTKIWVTWGDVQLEGGPMSIEKVGKRVRLKGRGGTDLCWPFMVADRMKIPVVVYFTDGYGQAPQRVKQKVMWVLTKDSKRPAEYGFVVKLG